jgi:fatty acid desaturase
MRPSEAQDAASGWRAVMDPAREEARRWVRRKRTFYTVIVVYLALVVLWFVIDVLTGTDDWWFYWPTLGAGVIVAIIGISMFGVSGLFGGDWERRQVDRYMERHRGPEDEGTGQT